MEKGIVLKWKIGLRMGLRHVQRRALLFSTKEAAIHRIERW